MEPASKKMHSTIHTTADHPMHDLSAKAKRMSSMRQI